MPKGLNKLPEQLERSKKELRLLELCLALVAFASFGCILAIWSELGELRSQVRHMEHAVNVEYRQLLEQTSQIVDFDKFLARSVESMKEEVHGIAQGTRELKDFLQRMQYER